MKRSSSLKRRVREIETASGTGALNIRNPDGVERGFSLSQKDRLKILIAGLDIAHEARNPESKSDSSSSPRAREIAQLIAEAEQVTPYSRLAATIAGTIQNAERDAEEDKRDGNKGDVSHYIQEDTETK
jgi:hypothetical protein